MAYTTIDDPSAYFKVQLWTGDGNGSRAIAFDDTDTNMQPDFVWIKARSFSENHEAYDAVRGVQKRIMPNDSGAEETRSQGLLAFSSDGFTVGTNDGVNKSSESFVSWNWKANGSGSSNEDGSINTASTSVNTTSGLSISKFVGTGSNATVGHGLGVAPKVVIVKDLDATGAWRSYTETTGNQSQIALDQNSAADSGNTAMWNSTSPTSTVFSLGTHGNINTNTNNYIAYSFANVQGYSKFGSYIGNASADGPFCFCGFRPAWVLVKNISATNNWFLQDNKRIGYNPANYLLKPNSSGADDTGNHIDILSNGFKVRESSANQNGSGNIMIYMAFAEAPLVNSNGVPCNAR